MKGARPLTPGEIALAQTVFGSAIDYDRVRIVRRKWWFFQPKGVVMAPTGNIHFHPGSDLYRDDFATADISLQGLFVHEMTHVMQSHQQGRFYLPLMRHPFCRYAFELKAGKRFWSYGLEQQAEIMRHIFLLRQGVTVPNQDELAALANEPSFGKA